MNGSPPFPDIDRSPRPLDLTVIGPQEISPNRFANAGDYYVTRILDGIDAQRAAAGASAQPSSTQAPITEEQRAAAEREGQVLDGPEKFQSSYYPTNGVQTDFGNPNLPPGSESFTGLAQPNNSPRQTLQIDTDNLPGFNKSAVKDLDQGSSRPSSDSGKRESSYDVPFQSAYSVDFASSDPAQGPSSLFSSFGSLTANDYSDAYSGSGDLFTSASGSITDYSFTAIDTSSWSSGLDDWNSLSDWSIDYGDFSQGYDWGGWSDFDWSSFDLPVVLDLDGNGISITQRTSSNIFFDLAGDGYQHRTAWAAAGDGVLALDVDGDGLINKREEIAFSSWDPGSTSDLQALRDVFDTNHDGKLDSGDWHFADFRLVVTAANGTTSVKTFADLGIQSIDLIADQRTTTLPDGTTITSTVNFTRTSGTTGTAGDVTLSYDTKGYALTQSSSTAGDGTVTVDTKARNTDGSLASETVSITSADGKTRTVKYDRKAIFRPDRRVRDGQPIETGRSDGGSSFARRPSNALETCIHHRHRPMSNYCPLQNVVGGSNLFH